MNDSVKSVLSSFVFYYPFFMSYFWIVGGLLHFFLFEQGRKHRATLLPRVPRVAIVVPCYNEGENVAEVIAHLDRMHYPNYRIIAVNDGSRDNTGALLNELAEQYPRLLVVHQSRNEGKAIGLNTAAQLSDAEFLLCIDGDSLPHPDSITYMLTHFLHAGHVGAVTGNPRIRNRSTVLGRMQVGEFSSIVGLIKRTQQLYGKLMTVSGVMTMFRKQALHQIGYWSPDMQTEDIDISWKLQLAGWTLRYEPRALTWILMPETFRGLFKQRYRWARGGIETALKYAPRMLNPRQILMWPIFLEFSLSVLWAYAMLFLICMAVLGQFVALPPAWQFEIFPRWHGTLLFLTCLAQLFAGCIVDRAYDYRIFRYFADAVWYPIAFWIIGMITTVFALPRVLFRRAQSRARWVSPDRGIKHESVDH
ncbi:poly-beta-1,6 N-acetyl-D-glucosamine synthase [Bordetella bronchiseptica MBORD681]|uniref:poly-beta-1,6-N-acetyl-D-glucosamine synthase n=1 Tax=Bordetella bronchiseptica TaxID=518 RepID=UPI000460DE92|nr:poly-beta-1,6-N-acetyl-D-glucosamine synthase [Bordetella bronchiseptica]KDD04602.1 poly-beta-1,6 N-acetyl-D-glucosamine synthase [Bordetella bronchiseptica MBORD698]KDD06936.1 poly-beta-1,6 N-acetyl-D-glucosamine synthase [Bordetella bronchiseptica MBORD681]KDD18432.1 poly-beta-1,6 N-acetyl-D-glucosamine synthase [Bordetella bronchiseptica MBORD731]